MGAVHVPGSLVERLASFTIKLIPIRPEIGPVSVMAQDYVQAMIQTAKAQVFQFMIFYSISMTNKMTIICVKMSSMFTSNTYITDAPPTTTDIWPSFGTRRSTPTTTDTGSFMFCESTQSCRKMFQKRPFYLTKYQKVGGNAPCPPPTRALLIGLLILFLHRNQKL